MVATTYGIVAASQPLAARAGTSQLEQGGIGVDAAISANAAIGLMEPTGKVVGMIRQLGITPPATDLLFYLIGQPK